MEKKYVARVAVYIELTNMALWVQTAPKTWRYMYTWPMGTGFPYDMKKVVYPEWQCIF